MTKFWPLPKLLGFSCVLNGNAIYLSAWIVLNDRRVICIPYCLN